MTAIGAIEFGENTDNGARARFEGNEVLKTKGEPAFWRVQSKAIFTDFSYHRV
jgi:hypothetical protein